MRFLEVIHKAGHNCHLPIQDLTTYHTCTYMYARPSNYPYQLKVFGTKIQSPRSHINLEQLARPA